MFFLAIYAWNTTGWNECSTLCGGGNETRDVFCEKTYLEMQTIETDEGLCTGTKPDNKQPCNEQKCGTS